VWGPGLHSHGAGALRPTRDPADTRSLPGACYSLGPPWRLGFVGSRTKLPTEALVDIFPWDSWGAANAGELRGARLSGVRVLVLLAPCFVAKN
jgi:hypothetical protein